MTIENGRFVIGSPIGQGKNGKVFQVTDTQNPDLPLVIKIQQDIEAAGQEVRAINKINTSKK
jgi:RIO-like serine/threonine protein kinase